MHVNAQNIRLFLVKMEVSQWGTVESLTFLGVLVGKFKSEVEVLISVAQSW